MRFTIRQARVHAGLTQESIAKLLRIDRSTYLKIEKDISRATVGQVNDISRITGIPVSDLILSKNSTKVESTA